MIIIKRCCFLTRNFHSLHQSTTFNDHSIFTLPKKCSLLRVSSSSGTMTKQGSSKETITDSDTDRKLKFIELEISLLRESGGRAPDVSLIKKHHWDELLTLKTATARQKFYNYLFLSERTKENKAMKRQQKREAREHQLALEPREESTHINYALSRVSFLLRIESPVMNLWRNNRLCRAMQFGDKLIFDCSYDEHMNNREAKNAAKQLTLSFAANRKDKQPFDLHYCNVNFNSETMKQMERYIPIMRNKEFPMNLYEGSYLDLFPRQQLVYLTPHCHNVLKEYDPNMIYIIGAMVDKGNQEALSLAKAKKLNLTMARLPLDAHLDWGSGACKSLTLDQMMKIMLDLKKTRDWKIALKHVPRRKVLTVQNNQRSKVNAFFHQTKKFS